MNSTFNIKRFGYTIQWEAYNQWKKYVAYLVGITLLFSISCIVVQTSLHIDMLNEQPHFPEDYSWIAFVKYLYAESVAVAFVTISIIAFCLLTTTMFNDTIHKQGRQTLLLLPANNVEKFLAKVFSRLIVCVIILLLAAILSDAIQWLFSFITMPNIHISISRRVIQASSEVILLPHSNYAPYLWSVMILFHALCTMGAIFFRKRHFLCTTASLLLLTCLFFWLYMPISDQYNSFTDFITTHQYLLCCINLVLAVIAYVGSYKIFMRMQLIGRKFTNL